MCGICAHTSAHIIVLYTSFCSSMCVSACDNVYVIPVCWQALNALHMIVCRVEYFGQRMEGFVFTEHGWVQSYGSRYVRPPIIHGDVSRPSAMTTKEFQYAQSLTQKPVKGMLTGTACTSSPHTACVNDQPNMCYDVYSMCY